MMNDAHNIPDLVQQLADIPNTHDSMETCFVTAAGLVICHDAPLEPPEDITCGDLLSEVVGATTSSGAAFQDSRCIVLKNVTLVTSDGHRKHMAAFVLFYDQIIGATLQEPESCG